MSSNEGSKSEYLRSAVKISKHPNKPLEGKRIALSSNRERTTEIDGDILGKIVTRSKSLYDIEKYDTGLRLGVVYFDAETRDAVGVSWEETPQPHGYKELSDSVKELPEDLVLIEELPENTDS